MIDDLVIRSAVASEQKALEALQRRASLENPGDRDALLANPDAIELPIEQIVAGHILVAEQDCGLVGFAVVLPREDGAAELDGLFVDPSSWRRGIGRLLVDRCAEVRASRTVVRIDDIPLPARDDDDFASVRMLNNMIEMR